MRRIRGNAKAPNVTQNPLNLNLIPNAKTGSMNLKTVLNGIQIKPTGPATPAQVAENVALIICPKIGFKSRFFKYID